MEAHPMWDASAPTLVAITTIVTLLVAVLVTPRAGWASISLSVKLLLLHFALLFVGSHLPEGVSSRETIRVVSLVALAVALGRALVLVVVDGVVESRRQRPLPRIIHDIIEGLTHFVLFLGLLSELGFAPSQLLTTSAVLTAVIGLSLQETVGNLIAGISIQMERPFSVGDWVAFDTNRENVGRVIGVNWRATTLLTLDEVRVVVPNSALAKSPLRVFTGKTTIARRSIFVRAPYGTPPHVVHEAILGAVRGSPGVLKQPPPSVVTNQFDDLGIEYWLRFYISEYGRRDGIDGEVRSRIWYQFSRRGIVVPLPHRTLRLEEPKVVSRHAEFAAALSKVDFLAVVAPAALESLAERATVRWYGSGEPIVQMGDTDAQFFLILQGGAEVVVPDGDENSPLRALGPGQYFGEMAVMTGAPRRATVIARAPSEMLVIDQQAFAPVINGSPEVLEKLSAILIMRRNEFDAHVAKLHHADEGAHGDRESHDLIDRIQRFFTRKP